MPLKKKLTGGDLVAFAEAGRKLPSLVVKMDRCVVTEAELQDFRESAIGTRKNKMICVAVTRDKSWVDPDGVVLCVWFLGLVKGKQKS